MPTLKSVEEYEVFEILKEDWRVSQYFAKTDWVVLDSISIPETRAISIPETRAIRYLPCRNDVRV